MSTSHPALQEPSFCSLINIESNADPVGSAQIYDAFLIMEFALPWKREVTDDDRFPRRILDAVDKAKEQGNDVRVQCVAPHPHFSQDGYKRIMYFTRPNEPFSRYDKVEYMVPKDHAGPLVEALLGGQSLDPFADYRQATDTVRDILVCTHGARDACCGKFGFDMYARLQQHGGTDPNDGIRIWRSSHLGGHRFAPTVLDFPSGRSWGNVTTKAVPLLVNLEGDVAQLRQHYRGWTALGTPAEQAAEGEMFRRIGWEWLTFPKSAHTVSEDEANGTTVVQMEWIDPATGEESSARFVVAVKRVVTGPASCGDEPEQWNEYDVTELGATASYAG